MNRTRKRRERSPRVRSELERSGRPSEWTKLTFVLPSSVAGLWEIARTRAWREGVPRPEHVTEHVRNGLVLEALIADYLAGPEYPAGSRGGSDATVEADGSAE